MTPFARRAPGTFALTVAMMIAAGGGCRRQPPAINPAPAKVTNPVKEVDLTTITLTAKAESRLGIQVGKIERRPVASLRTFGGEIVVPGGRSILVSAPVAGTVRGGDTLRAGTPVRRGQTLLQIVPLPSAAEISGSGIRVDAARRKAERAERLLHAGAGSERALEEARAELALAESSQAAGQGRGGEATTRPLVVMAPRDGVLRELLVAAGQVVATGAPLIHVDDLQTLWVRVPVYVGEIHAVDRAGSARVHARAPSTGETGVEAAPVAAPPTADARAATADLIYQLANAGGAFRPGQKVEVTLPLTGEQREQLVTAWSAIAYDIHGGSWVYQRTAPQVYQRRRVEVRHVTGPWAILSRGPAPGTPVAITGVAELFGTEFGAGK